MIKFYSIGGFNSDLELWEVFIALKGIDIQEAIDLLDHYRASHIRGCIYNDIQIEPLSDWEFKHHAQQEGCRAFVTKTAEKEEEEAEARAQTKKEMLLGAP
jgi:hypothetical protein